MWCFESYLPIDGVPWQFSYLFQASDEGVAWGPPKPENYPNKALSALFAFQGIDIPWIPEEQAMLKEHIRNHLMGFGGSNSAKEYTSTSHEIDIVCERARPLLAAYSNERPYQSEMKSSSPLYKMAFEERWLTNMSRLLPNDAEILKVLPYLLTCYTLEIRRNQIDPFDKDVSQYANDRAWVDIFYDQASPFVKDQRKTFGGVRRMESISKICSYFVLPINYKCNAFLGYLDVYDYTSTKGGRLLKPKERKEYCLACWESYRRFACFCIACQGVVQVDLIKSLALFSSIWDYRSPCRPFCNNPICEERKGQCRFESPNRIDLTDSDLSVLEFKKAPGSVEPTVQEFVFNMWNEYRYSNRPRPRLK